MPDRPHRQKNTRARYFYAEPVLSKEALEAMREYNSLVATMLESRMAAPPQYLHPQGRSHLRRLWSLLRRLFGR